MVRITDRPTLSVTVQLICAFVFAYALNRFSCTTKSIARPHVSPVEERGHLVRLKRMGHIICDDGL